MSLFQSRQEGMGMGGTGRLVRLVQILIVGVVACFVNTVSAAEYTTKTIDEIKTEVQLRADRNLYPLYGLKPADVRETLARIHSTDPEEWGSEWMKTADGYFGQAKAEEPTNTKAARDDYLIAYRYYAFGRWPVPSSPKKAECYARALNAFANYTRLADPSIEIVRVPFEGKEIVGYLLKPPGVSRPPVYLIISGADYWKEDLSLTTLPIVQKGVATLALDMPGTGQAPVAALPGSERMYSAMIDYLLTRNDVDGNRIVVGGASFGSYWATRVAFREPTRLRGAVFHSGPVHDYFQREWIEKSFMSTYYLFDYIPARLYILGKSTVEEVLKFMPTLSLKTEGLVAKPTPPMLLLAGVQDPQTPYSDLRILLENGSPKEAWVNPKGGHMGRTKDMDDQAIFEQVVYPWVLRHLDLAK